MSNCKMCGAELVLQNTSLCNSCKNKKQRSAYEAERQETDWEHFYRVYKDPHLRLAKYRAFLLQVEKHKGKWYDK